MGKQVKYVVSKMVMFSMKEDSAGKSETGFGLRVGEEVYGLQV